MARKNGGLGGMNRRFTTGLAGILALCLGTSAGQGAKPFADFTFKTVKPPAKGTQKLITIQISPDTPTSAVPAAPLIAPSAAPKAGGPFVQTMDAWFWDKISPRLDAAAPGRFGQALDVLARTPQATLPAAPAIDMLHRLVADYGTDILVATLGKAISPALVLALIAVEREKTPLRLSGPAQAADLMRPAPDISADFKPTDPADPAQNINAGVAHLDRLLRRFGNDPILALAAYQAGPAAITANIGVPPFAETRDFVPRVLVAFQVAKTLCITPPQLYSDGCVFLFEDPK